MDVILTIRENELDTKPNGFTTQYESMRSYYEKFPKYILSILGVAIFPGKS